MKILAFLSFAAFLFFLGIGYYFSDTRFFKQIIERENINSPLGAFHYVKSKTYPIQAFSEQNSINGLTPRYLLTTRKRLWCDEGAILFITFVHQLGYKTRLTDLLDKGTSRHTVAEVYEGSKWVLYDYTNNKVDVTYQESAGHFTPVSRHRPYPRFYNFLVQNNYFLKELALYLRSIPETDIPDFSR
jgi:hypothetical protein